MSIVTTVYDRVECLALCMRSVANLGYRNQQHIIVADHPPPEVFAELRTLVANANDSRVELYNLPERTNDFGISPAAFGLRKSVGKYVSFLDDDNVYLGNHFDALVTCLEDAPDVGFVYSACLFDGDRILDDPTPSEGKIDLGQVLFRRELFRTCFNDELNWSGYTWDWHLIRDLMSCGVTYRFIEQETFIFRLKDYGLFEPEALLVSARVNSDQLKAQVTTLQGEVGALKGEVFALQGEAKQLQNLLVGVQEDRDALQSRITATDHEISALRTSKSWRVTAPLRAILDLFLGRGR